MDGPIANEVHQLKELWIKERMLYKKRLEILQAREEIAERGEALRHELQALFADIHKKNNFKISHESLETTSKEKRALLKRAEMQLAQLDAQIDESEHLSEESLGKLKNELIEAISSAYPAQIEEYILLEETLRCLEELQSKFIQIEDACRQTCSLLGSALSARNSIKGLGFAQYIFGTSPNLIIIQSLNSCGMIAKKVKPLLSDLQEEAGDKFEIKKMGKELYSLFDSLYNQCGQRWGFRHLDTVFVNLQREMKKWKEKIESENEKLALARSALGLKLERLIEQCGN